MTLALRLSQRGYKVTIFESADKVGGLTRSWEVDGTVLGQVLSCHFNVRFEYEKAYCRNRSRKRIQMGGDKNRFLFWRKALFNVERHRIFKFPPINLIDKFRLGLTIFVASKIKNWQKLEKILVAEWLNSLSGKRVFEKIWLPLLKAKLGENYKNTSAAFIWTTIQRMYAARKSGLKKEMFGYVTGGYEKINKQFAKHLLKSGVNI